MLCNIEGCRCIICLGIVIAYAFKFHSTAKAVAGLCRCPMIRHHVASNLHRGVAKHGTNRPHVSLNRCALPSSVQGSSQAKSQKLCVAGGTASLWVQCRAVVPDKAHTAAVVEYVHLLEAKPDVDAESMDVLLDSLWSLQYMVPSIMCAAAGPVTDCTLYRQQQVSPDSSRAEEGAVSSGRFTHAVHFRLSSRSALENLHKHPLMSKVQEQVNNQCSTSARIVFEGLVAKRLETLFRRGDEFASGVEHVLLLQPSNEEGMDADMFLEKLAAFAESSTAGGVQASYGRIVCSDHTLATHVLMTRFAALQQMQQFLQTPACAAVLRQDPRVPVVAASSLCISVQPNEDSAKVSGAGSFGL